MFTTEGGQGSTSDESAGSKGSVYSVRVIVDHCGSSGIVEGGGCVGVIPVSIADALPPGGC